MPTYNEAKNVPILIPQIFDEAKRIDSHELHILIVDDNSPDGTKDVVLDLMKSYPNLHIISGEKEGLGEAYKRGMAQAIAELKPDLIFEMDADLQHDPKMIPVFISMANKGFSLVIGSRFISGGSTPNFSLYRKGISLLGNWLIRFFGGMAGIQDCTSGYRCIKADLIPKCNMSNLATRGYSFQSSLIYELLRNGAKPIEIPIIFPDRQHGESKLALRDQVEFLLNLARIRFKESKEFINFCIVGTSGIVINMGFYVFFSRALGLRMEYASVISIELSVITNFILNNFWTFRHRASEARWWGRIKRFHLVAGIGGGVNFVCLILLVRRFGMWDIYANLIGIILATLIKFKLNSNWTWREKDEEF